VSTLAVVGAGPKGIAIAAKARALAAAGLPAPRVVPVDRGEVAGNWSGRQGYTSGLLPLGTPRWADTTVLSGDLAAAIGELKAKPAGELQVHGSGTLVRWLLENDLVDEMTLLIVPVVLGQGTRLFPGTGPDTALDLAVSQPTRRG
jgi:hypothetical protein